MVANTIPDYEVKHYESAAVEDIMSILSGVFGLFDTKTAGSQSVFF